MIDVHILTENAEALLSVTQVLVVVLLLEAEVFE